MKRRFLLSQLELFDELQERGISVESLLDKHHIDLDTYSAHAFIEPEVEFEFLRDVIQITGDQQLGLAVGKRIKLSSYGLYGLLAMSAPTYGESVLASIEYQKLNHTFSEISLHKGDGFLELRFVFPDLPDDLRNYAVDRDFAGTLAFLEAMIPPSDLAQVSAGLARPEPEDGSAYLSPGGKRPKFDQPYSWFRMRGVHVNKKMPHANRLAHQLYKIQARELLNSLHPESEDIETRIFRLLKSYDSSLPKIAEVAARLQLSERSLRRALAQQGTSFRALSERFRKEKAIYLLTKQGLSVTDVAYSLGFSDLVSFSTSFKRWTGSSPSKFVQERSTTG